MIHTLLTASFAALLAARSFAVFDDTEWSWRSPVTVEPAATGFVRLPLPPEILDGAQPSLNDLRLLDAEGNLAPYLVHRERTQEAQRVEWRAAQLLNQTYVPGSHASVTLDFGKPVEKSRLRVVQSGDNFRRRALLEGSADNQKWATVADNTWLFAIKDPSPGFKVDTIEFPPNDFRYLRLSIYNMPDDPNRITIHSVEAALAVRLPPGALIPVQVASLTGPIIDARERASTFEIDLGLRNLPVDQIGLGIKDPHFYRGIELSGRNAASVEVKELTESGPETKTREAPWQPIVRGVVYRIKDGDKVAESAQFENVNAPYRYLRIRVLDGDNPPLAVGNVEVFRREVSIVFERKPGETYTLLGGNPGAAAPSFDLGRAVPRLGESTLPLAQAGAPQPLAHEPVLPPWTERHTVLLWVALIVAVAAMLALIASGLRSLGQKKGG